MFYLYLSIQNPRGAPPPPHPTSAVGRFLSRRMKAGVGGAYGWMDGYIYAHPQQECTHFQIKSTHTPTHSRCQLGPLAAVSCRMELLRVSSFNRPSLMAASPPSRGGSHFKRLQSETTPHNKPSPGRSCLPLSLFLSLFLPWRCR